MKSFSNHYKTAFIIILFSLVFSTGILFFPVLFSGDVSSVVFAGFGDGGGFGGGDGPAGDAGFGSSGSGGTSGSSGFSGTGLSNGDGSPNAEPDPGTGCGPGFLNPCPDPECTTYCSVWSFSKSASICVISVTECTPPPPSPPPAPAPTPPPATPPPPPAPPPGTPPPPPGSTECSDGIDNDGDGGSDATDPGCWYIPGDPDSGYNPNDDSESSGPPVIDISALPALVKKGSGSTIVWSAENVTNCSVTGPSGEFDSDSSAPFGGSKDTGEIETEQLYTLTCTGLEGEEVSASILIRVLPSFQEF